MSTGGGLLYDKKELNKSVELKQNLGFLPQSILKV